MAPPRTTVPPIQEVSDAPPTAPPRPSGMLLPFDPILFLAVIGLCIGSLLTIADATADDIAGQPHYYVTRQAIFFGVGMLLALILSRVDYSRLRELKYFVYGLLIASIVAVQLLGSVARGSRRAIDTPFFSFQASELGKVLLVVALSAFIVDRSRRLQARDTTARIMLLTLIPAAMVIVQPDLGSGMVYIVIGLATLFVAGTGWRHFASLFALGAIALALTLVVAPKMGVTVLHDLPEGAPDGFPEAVGEPRRPGLPAEPVAYRHRLR